MVFSIEITHSIAPVNLHYGTPLASLGKLAHPTVCPIMLTRSNLFLEISLQWWTGLI